MFARFILLVSLLLVSTGLAAKKLYKYKDDNGNWHYTDRPPANAEDLETRQLVEVRQLIPAPKQRVWLKKFADKDSSDFYVLNQYPGPIEMEVIWSSHDNVTATPDLPLRFVVEPGKSNTLFKIGIADRTRPGRFGVQHRFILGQPLPNYLGETLYAPPIAPNSHFQITQGFGGKFSHADAQNRYAIDLNLPVDTAVFAARGGVVLESEDDYFRNGTEPSYASKANNIRILHADGSMAVYAHLALEKSLVSPGATVTTGQLIGYSGNTGLTTGPHLHFAVQINRGMELVSVPFKFADEHNQAVEPRQGLWLTGHTAGIAYGRAKE